MSIVVCTEQRGLFQTSRLLLRESFDQIVCLDISRLSEVRDKPKVTALICGLDSFVDSKILELFPNLKYVVSPTTGVTHLDQHELEKYVRVITLQTEKEFLNTITSTAEIAWFHLLNAGRHGANEIATLASSGNWNRYRFESCQISSRIVGIIGYGRLGKRLSEYCRAFQISRTMFFDPFVDQNNKESEVIKVNTLKDLIDQCDTLFVTATLSEDTQGLISRELLERCRQNTIIVNVSRGELVDHVALIDVLVEKKTSSTVQMLLSTKRTLTPKNFVFYWNN